MRIRLLASLLGLACVFAAQLPSGLAQETSDPHHAFRLSSSTFDNNTTLPISAIHNNIVNGSNICSIDGSPGGNESPELSWTRPSRNTQSFVVVLYDETASFTHWLMYNISPHATGLPQNAGVADSQYGQQVANNMGRAEYDGPCPPPGLAPVVHQYVFTVYALDIRLDLPASANFPANPSTLYQALIEAGEDGDILESASITGLYSTTPSQ